MKKQISSKSLIGLLLSVLIVSATGYLLKTHWGWWEKRVPLAKVKPRRGMVEGVSYTAVQSEMKACYESMLVRNPELANGDVLFHFMFDKSGSINFLELVHSDFDEPQFQDCVTQKIKEMQTKVPESRIGILIAHRFKFHRRDETNIQFE